MYYRHPKQFVVSELFAHEIPPYQGARMICPEDGSTNVDGFQYCVQVLYVEVDSDHLFRIDKALNALERRTRVERKKETYQNSLFSTYSEDVIIPFA
jgi:hypothetical protein